MTEAQEMILDRLMVAELIGVQGPAGPLGLAVEALGPLRGAGGSRIPRTLGWPGILRQALQAASAALEGLEQRRQVAVTFFSVVAPRRKAPALGPSRQVELALWCALRVHPLVCRRGCPCAGYVEEAVRGFLAERRPSAAKWPRGPLRCSAVLPRDWSDVGPHGSPEESASAALGCALSVASLRDSGWYSVGNAKWAGWHAARVAALVKEVKGAVSFCLALAREMGLWL
jgi:hypothetical protein